MPLSEQDRKLWDILLETYRGLLLSDPGNIVGTLTLAVADHLAAVEAALREIRTVLEIGDDDSIVEEIKHLQMQLSLCEDDAREDYS